jgi:hypothetical protein
MKTLKQIILTGLVRGAAVGALLLGAVQTSHAGTADPSAGSSFTWDVVSSGAGQRGLAVITFSNDLTFRGYQLLAANAPNTNSANAGRGGGDTGRGGSTGGTNSVQTLLFGFTPIDGVWTISSQGKIVGFFSEAVNVTSIVTNFFASTNTFTLVNPQTTETTNVQVAFTNGQGSANITIDWPNPPPGFNQDYVVVNTNFTLQVGSAESTNVVSFTGTAVANKHITLVSSTTFGKMTFSGVPIGNGVDVSGNWIGTKKENGHSANEFFSLTSSQVANPFPAEFPDAANFPNIFFTTDGLGAGYTFTGVAMVSRKNKIGFQFNNNDGTARAMMGSLKASKHGTTATTKGVEVPLTEVNFTATLQ